MTDDEQSLLSLGVQLRDGIQDMIDCGRLDLFQYPDDDQWLLATLRQMAELCQSVETSRG